MLKGLYHWARVCGIGVAPTTAFAVAFDRLADGDRVLRGDRSGRGGRAVARGAWGAVVWLTAVASMVAVEMFFPQVLRRHAGDRADRRRRCSRFICGWRSNRRRNSRRERA